MDKKEFAYLRKQLAKTQKELAVLLGKSIKAVHSYEQGWRRVPSDVEKQLFLLLSMMKIGDKDRKNCWVMKHCPTERKKKCPAWEFRAGKFCLFINGTICEGAVQGNWHEKMALCRKCEVLKPLLPPKDTNACDSEK